MATAIDVQTCNGLRNAELENAVVTSATVVAEGPFSPPSGFQGPPGAAQSSQPLPEHCRVILELSPTEDSRINAELWLPMADWNGKFMAIGNGGWAGSIQGYPDMQRALQRG